MKIPRASAYISRNLTAVEYYRGQNTLLYDIFEENEDLGDFQLFRAPEIFFQDGTSAAPLATVTQDLSVLIQTDDEDMVGVQKLIIRDYDDLDRLLELNLYVRVNSNTHPDFVTEPMTIFTMEPGEQIAY